MSRRIEADVCIIGAGISAAMLAQKLAEKKPQWKVVLVEAGKRLFDVENRMKYRQRYREYAENPWTGDFIPDMAAQGIISRTMTVGGSAMHWGGACNRFSEEDTRLRSHYGLAVDWPIEWKELERYTCEAERRLGVAGEPGPFPEDARSEPYPMPPMPLTYNLRRLKEESEKQASRSGRHRRRRIRGLMTDAPSVSAAAPAPSARPAPVTRPTSRSASCWRRRRSNCTTRCWCGD